ncbi:hypothetical protein LS70_008575 [Helicobacter sp. MIT 11-5569]|jgi:hypothetical protein|uniref:hypothetical protein n=1 Tax=Helicobacter TaxID=209 RepID=UPI00047BEDA6|nr:MULTISPECIES: hypothetical protein [Helicobacter]TLD80725.1 hypothetical protein LS70_008575 [Helicobacter sp. MIT 11-5569]
MSKDDLGKELEKQGWISLEDKIKQEEQEELAKEDKKQSHFMDKFNSFFKKKEKAIDKSIDQGKER